MQIQRRFTPVPALPAVADEDASRVRERFRLAGRAAQELIWDWDLARGTVAWDGNTLAYFGTPVGAATATPGADYALWASHVHPDDLAQAETAVRLALQSGAESWQHEYRFRRADDSWAQMLERAFIVRDDEGGARRIVGTLQDISRRKATEEATTRLAAIVASSSDAIVSMTLEGIVTTWNAAAERIFGYTTDEMVGQPIFRLIPAELHAPEREMLARIRRGERVEFSDTERVRKDGGRIYIALTNSPITDAAGTVVGASSIKRDITDRKRADEELARREERYRALVTATTSIVWTADPDGRFREPQASWEQYTGQSWEAHRDFGWINAIHPEDRARARDAWLRASEQAAIYEARCRVSNAAHDAYRHCIVRAAPVLSADGAVREWIGMVTDIEENWLTQERLQRAERMESVGRLAGGIAHEANNQMTVILGTAEFLERQPMTQTAREDVEQIRRAAHRTAAITQQLLAFSRRQVLQMQTVDLNAIVTSLAPILRRALGEISHVELHLAADLGAVKADPGQLDQVLLNLALNARDAMPNGGRLTIQTTNVILDQTYVATKGLETMTPGRYAMLMVSDTGQGMDADTLSHIFEPFFTTKDVGQGTGLGLATVYGIIKQSNGFVWAYSEPDHGTAFKIYLPLTPRPTAARQSTDAAAPDTGREVILIAEDEPSVRTILTRTLRELGYTVLEAGNGEEALAIIEQRDAPPDLILADVVMPKMGGRELATQAASRWPGIAVLFTSGYTGADAIGRGLLEEGRDFIQKPLDPKTLAEKVRQVLDERDAPTPN